MSSTATSKKDDSTKSTTGKPTLSLTQLFGLVPNKNYAIMAASTLYALAAICLLITLFTAYHTSSWFTLLIAVGCAIVATGFIMRLKLTTSSEAPKLRTFVIMQIMIFVSPLLLAAANYKCLSNAADPFTTPGIVFWAPLLFILADIVCLVVQMTGASMLSDVTKAKTATNLLLIGSYMAVAVNAIFVAVLLYTQIATSRGPVVPKEVFVALYVTTALLAVRNVYHIVELSSDSNTENFAPIEDEHAPKVDSIKPQKSEVLTYLFDFAVIVACMLFYCALHFGLYIPNNVVREFKSTSYAPIPPLPQSQSQSQYSPAWSKQQRRANNAVNAKV